MRDYVVAPRDQTWVGCLCVYLRDTSAGLVRGSESISPTRKPHLIAVSQSVINIWRVAGLVSRNVSMTESLVVLHAMTVFCVRV